MWGHDIWVAIIKVLVLQFVFISCRCPHSWFKEISKQSGAVSVSCKWPHKSVSVTDIKLVTTRCSRKVGERHCFTGNKITQIVLTVCYCSYPFLSSVSTVNHVLSWSALQLCLPQQHNAPEFDLMHPLVFSFPPLGTAHPGWHQAQLQSPAAQTRAKPRERVRRPALTGSWGALRETGTPLLEPVSSVVSRFIG